MKGSKLFLFFFGLVLASCQKEEPLADYAFEAEVLGRNLDCGVYQIKILNQLPRVEEIVGQTQGDSIFIAENLSSELEIAGLKILLDVRKTQNNETPCTTLGIGYPWLYVVRAKEK